MSTAVEIWPVEPSNVRKGRFLGLDEPSRNTYLTSLRKKISDGYFYSDVILSQIVEELAPVIDDAIERDLSAKFC